MSSHTRPAQQQPEQSHRPIPAWLTAVLLASPGLFIAWLAWPEEADPTAQFFVGVLVGLSISALVAGLVAYRTERRAHGRQSPGRAGSDRPREEE